MLPLEKINFTQETLPDGSVEFRGHVSMVLITRIPKEAVDQAKDNLILHAQVFMAKSLWQQLYGDFMPALHQIAQYIARSCGPKDLPQAFMREVWLLLNPSFKDIKYSQPEIIETKVNGNEPSENQH